LTGTVDLFMVIIVAPRRSATSTELICCLQISRGLMLNEGDWVKLAADEPSMGLKAGMLGKVTLVLNDPSSSLNQNSRTVYVVQLLSDGLGILTPSAATLPIVGDEGEFLPASPGEILFALGATALKGKLLPSSEPSELSSPSQPSPPGNPPEPPPPTLQTPPDQGAGLLLLLLPLLFFPKDMARLAKIFLILFLIFVVGIVLILVLPSAHP
jgi:hypothetical protein